MHPINKLSRRQVDVNGTLTSQESEGFLRLILECKSLCLKFLRLLFNNKQPKKKVMADDTTPTPKLTVEVINPGADKLSDALGISTERYQYLSRVTKKWFELESTLSGTIHEASKHANHPNELVIVGFLCGVFIREKSESRKKRNIQSLEDLLGSLNTGDDDDD